MKQHKLSWADPIHILHNIRETSESWAFFHSTMQTTYSGRFSYLAVHPIEIIEDNNFDTLSTKLSNKNHIFENAWFGYLGYGLKHSLENVPSDIPIAPPMPPLWMARYNTIFQWDHQKGNLFVYTDAIEDAILLCSLSATCPPKATTCQTLESNMSRQAYLEKVIEAKEAIARGDLGQVNLTRRFYGKLTGPQNAITIFNQLSKLSPSPYSALLKCGRTYIISSSPEQFLNIDARGNVETRPIKGSRERRETNQLEQDILALQNSDKDRAENLMIADLMRNDLSRHCSPGSVIANHLFAVESFATIHHMHSTITGKKSLNASTLELVKGCFPPGSMTGTPKIKAIELASQLEQTERGIYSGAIGWFGGDGSADLSVTIRTIILENDLFSFHVGGAIVSDSDPELEHQETMAKATAIAKTLGIPMEQLSTL